jgi:glutathione S-transferase
MLALYMTPGTSSMAVHIALHEVGAEFEIRSGERTPEFLRISPRGTVPALVVDGRPLIEVAGILFYLARRYPDAKLLPQGDPEAEAQIVSWMSWCASVIHPSFTLAGQVGKFSAAPDVLDAARKQTVETTNAAFDMTERMLAGREWAVGRYSIADIHIFRLYWRWSNLHELDPARFPGLEAHYRRMKQRPAVRRTLEREAAIGYAPNIVPRRKD